MLRAKSLHSTVGVTSEATRNALRTLLYSIPWSWGGHGNQGPPTGLLCCSTIIQLYILLYIIIFETL